MSDPQNHVHIALPTGMAILTEPGCYTIAVKADGMLEIRELLRGIVAVYATGCWSGAVLTPTTRETA